MPNIHKHNEFKETVIFIVASLLTFIIISLIIGFFLRNVHGVENDFLGALYVLFMFCLATAGPYFLWMFLCCFLSEIIPADNKNHQDD